MISLVIGPAIADPATIQVTPGPAYVLAGTPQAFKAQGYDANGNLIAAQPTWTWSVSGGGAIDTYGNMTGYSPGTVTVTATSGSATGTAVVTVIGGGDLLSGSMVSSAASANLTTMGLTGDWVHYGRGVPGVDRAANGGAAGSITAYTKIGNPTVGFYRMDPRLLAWTNGTPTAASSSNPTGVYATGNGAGFQFTCPASPSQCVLTIYLGGDIGGGMLTAHLSSGTAPDYTYTAPTRSGLWDDFCTLTFSTALPGQTLTVKWTATAATGQVTLEGATLATNGM